MTLRNFIKTSAFILIIVGTAGLLLNEFVWAHSSTRTIIFGVVNLVGLVNLAFAHWGMKEKREMQKPNTVGFTPPDFPKETYDKVRQCLNKYKDTHEVQWMLFSSGWNGLADRYRTMAEYDKQFTTYVREFGNSPPTEERYQQSKALFGFFTNAVSVIEIFSFSAHCIASILKPDIFPVSEPKDLRFYLKDVEQKFADNFPDNPLSLSMSHCLIEPTYGDMCDIRDVLSHRGMPPRKFYQGGERHGMATMPKNPKAPSDQWQFDFPVDERTTKMFREWLGNELGELMDSADKFCASRLRS